MKNQITLLATFAIAILCLVGASGSNLTAASSTAASFRAAARDKLQQADLRLSSEAASEFDAMLESAAQQLSSASEEKRNEAAAALDTFIRELAKEHAQTGKSSDKISRETFHRAKANLCPLWPFC